MKRDWGNPTVKALFLLVFLVLWALEVSFIGWCDRVMPSLPIVRGYMCLPKRARAGWVEEQHPLEPHNFSNRSGNASLIPFSTPELAFNWGFYKTSSFHKPLLKIYDVKFVGRIFMEGRVALSKGVPVFTMGLHHLSFLFLGGFSSPCHVQDSLVIAWAQVWRWPCPEWIPLSSRRCGETRALVNISPHCNFKPRSPHGPSFL